MAFAASARLLGDVLASQAAARPDAVAIEFGGEELRYGEFAHRAERAARSLASLGVVGGDRIAWLGLNHPAQLVLLFAVARLGAMLLPLNTRLAPAEWDAVLEDCAPRLLFHDDAMSAAARDVAGRRGLAIQGVDALDKQAPGAASDIHVAPDVPVLLVCTSGTTGRPKAAVHTQANLVANMAIAAQVQGMVPADSVLTVLPLFHVGGLCIQTLPALYAGARVTLQPRFDPVAFFDALETMRPTLTLLVPATMKALVEHPRWAGADLSSLRAVWAGSSLLPDSLLQAFHARGVPVCNVYGATETGPFSIALDAAHAKDKVGSCGRPAPGVEARLHDVRQGAGEILLRAPNVVSHYWPDQPACDASGWFHTGDLATQDVDGSFRVVGRARDLIISGGENIHPAEIESALSTHPAVAECAAFGRPDAKWGEVVGVAVVLAAGASATQEELELHLAGRIARFKLPKKWFFVEALPKTALGKVQRSALRDL